MNAFYLRYRGDIGAAYLFVGPSAHSDSPKPVSFSRAEKFETRTQALEYANDHQLHEVDLVTLTTESLNA